MNSFWNGVMASIYTVFLLGVLFGSVSVGNYYLTENVTRKTFWASLFLLIIIFFVYRGLFNG